MNDNIENAIKRVREILALFYKEENIDILYLSDPIVPVTIRFPEITCRNSRGDSFTSHELYAMFNLIRSESQICLDLSQFVAKKGAGNMSEILRCHVHTHPGPGGAIYEWRPMCLGTGPLVNFNNLSIIKNGVLNEPLFKAFLIAVKAYFEWENNDDSSGRDFPISKLAGGDFPTDKFHISFSTEHVDILTKFISTKISPYIHLNKSSTGKLLIDFDNDIVAFINIQSDKLGIPKIRETAEGRIFSADLLSRYQSAKIPFKGELIPFKILGVKELSYLHPALVEFVKLNLMKAIIKTSYNERKRLGGNPTIKNAETVTG